MSFNAANPRSMASLCGLGFLAVGLIMLPALASAADEADAPRSKEVKRDGDAPREGDRPREVRRDGDEPARERPRDGDRPREGDRPRDGERAPQALEKSGAGTFVRIERGAALLSDDERDKDVRVAVKDGTKVTIDGQPATMRELRAGMPVTATHAEGVTTLAAKRPRWLKALAPREGERAGDGERPRGEADKPREGDRPRGENEKPRGEGERPRVGEADGERRPAANVGRATNGILQKVDGSSLVLSVGENGREMIVPTDANTKVIVSGAAGKLADLEPGMMMSVRQVEGLTTEVNARPRRK